MSDNLTAGATKSKAIDQKKQKSPLLMEKFSGSGRNVPFDMTLAEIDRAFCGFYGVLLLARLLRLSLADNLETDLEPLTFFLTGLQDKYRLLIL